MNLRFGYPIALVCTCIMPLLSAFGQISGFPYRESFDSVAPPALPRGWTSTRNKGGGSEDFVTSAGTARSGANAILATNATIEQELLSPIVDWRDWVPVELLFFTRRSSTFNAAVVIEVSTDRGLTFPILLGDTLRGGSTSGYVQTTFPIPHALIGSSGIMFRWRIVPASNGATGTFRIDDISISVRPAFDLAVRRLGLQPNDPDELTPISALVTIGNCGASTARSSVVQVRWEELANLERERRAEATATIDSLMAGDSAFLTVNLGPVQPGTSALIVTLSDTLDQDRSNDTMRLPCHVGYRSKSAVINEIMYGPSSPEPEWVELLNTHGDFLSLQGWAMSDATVSSRHIMGPGQTTIPPGEYVLLTRDTLALREAHPSLRSPVLAVQGFPSLNNSGDAVVIYDHTGRVIDSIVYDPSWGGNDGRSLERVDYEASSVLSSNWGPSKNQTGSTPGDSNSIARKEFDLVLDSMTLSPIQECSADTLLLAACFHNAGRQQAYGCEIDIDRCNASDSAGGLILTMTHPEAIAPLEIVRQDFRYCPHRSGNLHFRGRIVALPDQDLSNNSCWKSVVVDHPPGAVRINEIVADPPAGIPEWVEVANLTADTIDLGDWRIGNRNTSTRYRFPGDAGWIPPFGFQVVTKDTTLLLNAFGSLGASQVAGLPASLWNNTADAVVLEDLRHLPIDSVYYRPTWRGGSEGSLERRDPLGMSNDSTNWGPSTDLSGATPGRRNSIAILSHDLSARRLYTRLDTHEQVIELHLIVQNAGKSVVTGAGVDFFVGSDGDTLQNGKVFLGRAEVTQGMSARDSCDAIVRWVRPPSGLSIITAIVDTTGDERPGNNGASCRIAMPFAAGTMVINEIMYDPNPGGAEYVELFNGSGSSVDIAQWSLGGHVTASGASQHRVLLSAHACRVPPAGFIVAAADSAILDMFPSLLTYEQAGLIIGSWGSFGLPNSGDEIILRDGAGVVIDSVAYTPLWHRGGIRDPSGHSLERIRPALGSNDPRNWSTSVDKRGGTPGEVNSINVGTESQKNGLSFSPNPFSPDGDGYEDFTLIHYEAPVPVAVVNIRIFDVRGRLIRVLANHEASASRGDVLWDGRDDGRESVRMGVYVVFLEGCDDRGVTRWSARGAVVVARKL